MYNIIINIFNYLPLNFFLLLNFVNYYFQNYKTKTSNIKFHFEFGVMLLAHKSFI